MPEDLRINVRYGGNREGEPYTVGEDATHQAVFCKLDPEVADASTAGVGAGGGASVPQTLRCSLYTQGPARLDASAQGYEPISDQALSLDTDARCEHEIKVTLRRAADAGAED